MTSLRSFAALRPAGWLLFAHLGLLATPQTSPASPGRPSALRRWWHSLGPRGLRVESTDQGTQLTEFGGGGPERAYRTWKDAQGAEQEAYWENGVAKPVDEAVHQWAVQRMHEAQTPIPPIPPIPTMPPPPPAPPVPPAPPAPAPFSGNETRSAVLQRVQQDPRVSVLAGSPVVLGPLATGSVTTWGPNEPQGWMRFSRQGGAVVDLTFQLTGPKGAFPLHVKGTRKGSVWTYAVFEIQAGSGAPLNLLDR